MTVNMPLDDNDVLEDTPHLLSGLPGENVGNTTVHKNEAKGLYIDVQLCNTLTILQYPGIISQRPTVPEYINTVPQFTNENLQIQSHVPTVHDNRHASVSKSINITEYQGCCKQKHLKGTCLDPPKGYLPQNNDYSRFRNTIVYEEGSNFKCCAEARYPSKRCWCDTYSVTAVRCTGDQNLSDSDKVSSARLVRKRNRVDADITDKRCDSRSNNCNKSPNDFSKQEKNVALKSGQREINYFPHFHNHTTEHTFHNECKGASTKSYGHRCLYVPLTHLPKLNDSSSDDETEGKTYQYNAYSNDRHNGNCRYSNNCKHFERYRRPSDEHNHGNGPCGAEATDKQIPASDDDYIEDKQTQFQSNELVFVEDHFGLLTGCIASGISNDFRLPQSENVEIHNNNIKHGQQIRMLEINGISKVNGLENTHETMVKHTNMRGIRTSEEITGLRTAVSKIRHSNSTSITNFVYEIQDVNKISEENKNEDNVSIAFCDICKEETGLCVCIFI